MVVKAALDGSNTTPGRRPTEFHNGAMGHILDGDIIDYLFWCRDVRNLSEETIRVRRGVLDRLSDTLNMPLRDAQIGHLQRWQQFVLTGKAPETKKAYISHVSAFYAWAFRRGLVRENPAVLLDRPKVPKGLPHPISEVDLAQAIVAASPKLAAMITLTADAGLRCMEVAGLQWADIRHTDRGWFLFVRGKGRKERLVPVGESVIETIRRYRWSRRGPVFLGREGGQITPNAVSQMINDHYERLGIQATAHHGRHRYVSVGVDDVGDVVLMQHLAGHESLATTQIYTAFSLDKAQQVIKALERRANRRRTSPMPRPAPAPDRVVDPDDRTAS